MIKLIFKLFGGKLSSMLASGVLYLSLWIVAHLVSLDPRVAGMVDPVALAATLTAVILSGFNALTNAVHIQALDDINEALQATHPITEIPVEKAEPVK